MSGSYAGPLHRNPPFRAEHLGSLKRPRNLLDKRNEVDEKKAKESDLTPIEDAAIKDIVKAQLDLGFHAISDGEYRRHMFFGGFYEGLAGMETIKVSQDILRQYVPDIAAFAEMGHGPVESVVCTGKIKHTGTSCYLPQYEYLKTLVPKENWGDIKITLAAPNWYHLRYIEGHAYKKDVYANDDEYFADIAKAWQDELDILYKAGARNLQFDDPNLACKSAFMRSAITVALISTIRFLFGEDACRLEGG
jgi:methionine synthase II (cobalamin-independent)